MTLTPAEIEVRYFNLESVKAASMRDMWTEAGYTEQADAWESYRVDCDEVKVLKQAEVDAQGVPE